MPTANDLIESAAIKLGAIQTGEALTADEASDCLSVLNSLLDFWRIDRLMVFQIVQSQHTWTGGQASRTIGTGGNFNVARPVRVEEGTFFSDGAYDYPVTVIRDRKTYDNILYKDSQGSYPNVIYYEQSYPLGTLYVAPVPESSITLNLNTWQTLQSFSSLTESLSLPPGYQWMIENNLAVALEPVFTVPVPPSVAKAASDSMARIKKFNHVPITSPTEVPYMVGVRKGHNIYADQ